MEHNTFLVVSGQSLASNGPVVDTKDLNLVFSHKEATHNKLFFSSATKYTVEHSWTLVQLLSDAPTTNMSVNFDYFCDFIDIFDDGPAYGIYEIYRALDPLRDCAAYRKLIEPVHKQEQERNRPKPSRIPVYSKKHWESGPAKEYVKIPCECGKDSLTNPSNRSWRLEGHAIYCPKAAIAYRCYLNNKLESLFRVISKRQYCGNIIDSSSHARWMRMAGIYEDEDASCFKKFANPILIASFSKDKKAYLSAVGVRAMISMSSAKANNCIQARGTLLAFIRGLKLASCKFSEESIPETSRWLVGGVIWLQICHQGR
ncbi:uncharacterized protein TNCV_4703141 [Trichonephila clavipes]|nr:uncharacterized protein TNCV_4703141 [Trichonephila clavipes]